MDEIEVDRSISQIDRIIRGMLIIQKYETDPHPCAAEHDVFYCGSYATREQMTEDERRLMQVYGWGEEYDSWRFFT